VSRLVLVTLALASVFTLACKARESGQDAEQTAADHAKAAAAIDPVREQPAAAIDELPPLTPLALEIAEAVDPARYEADLSAIAAPRPPGSDHWSAVQARCAETLEQAGFEVSRFIAEDAGVNVIGRKRGRNPELPVIVVGAHYDHIEGCAGADDNASGTAAALELARVLGGTREWERSLLVACWDEEESGLNGSRAWVDRAIAEGERIDLYLNFDAIAYADATPGAQTLPPGIDLLFAEQVAELEARQFRADFIALLADDAARRPSRHYLAHAGRLELPVAHLELPSGLKNGALLADLRRSDHASFWHHDIPAIFLSDTADFRTDTYHCMKRPDTVETLDLEFAVKVTRAAAGMLVEALSE
jgi:hypothetical protein